VLRQYCGQDLPPWVFRVGMGVGHPRLGPECCDGVGVVGDYF
jgi:hypothetical protein